MPTFVHVTKPFRKIYDAYHYLSVLLKFCVLVTLTGTLVGTFCGVLIGIGKLSDNLGMIILTNGGNQTGVSAQAIRL